MIAGETSYASGVFEQHLREFRLARSLTQKKWRNAPASSSPPQQPRGRRAPADADDGMRLAGAPECNAS
jgi:hypothetical protein